MVRVIIKCPDGEVIDEWIKEITNASEIFEDAPNGGIVICFKDRTYITHFSNVCIIEAPEI